MTHAQSALTLTIGNIYGSLNARMPLIFCDFELKQALEFVEKLSVLPHVARRQSQRFSRQPPYKG